MSCTGELQNLFNYYGSDKGAAGYAPLYSTLFRGFRGREVKLLEIGIGSMTEGAYSSMAGYAHPSYIPGASLRAWRDYFPKGQIVGADVQADTQFTEERISTVLIDSTDAQQLRDSPIANQTFDIIVDDAGHDALSQLRTLENMLPLLKPEGVYVVEDVGHDSWISENLEEWRARFPRTQMFLVGKDSNQLVVTNSELVRGEVHSTPGFGQSANMTPAAYST